MGYNGFQRVELQVKNKSSVSRYGRISKAFPLLLGLVTAYKAIDKLSSRDVLSRSTKPGQI